MKEQSLDHDNLPVINENDTIDTVFQKYLTQMRILENMNIVKEGEGLYRVEKKIYKFMLIGKERQLVIRMHAGCIFAENLVHYGDELESIVRK